MIKLYLTPVIMIDICTSTFRSRKMKATFRGNPKLY